MSSPLRLEKRSRSSFVNPGDHAVPLYKSIKAELTRMLTGGANPNGKALTTQPEQAQSDGGSLGPERRALAALGSQKVVVRQQGRGTFLAPFDTRRMLNSFWRIRRKDGEVEAPLVRTLDFDRDRAEPEVAHRLGLAPGAPVYRIVNLMLMGGRPVLVDNLQIPCALFPSLTLDRFIARDATIYDLYRDSFGVNIVKTEDHVGAVGADRATAKLLGRPVGTPLLEIVRVAHTFGERPVEYRRSLLDSQHYEFVDVTGGDSGG